MSDPAGATVVLGVGNPIMADDGVGPTAVARLRSTGSLPDEVVLVDGGTWGLTLLPTIETADRLLIVDAIHRGEAPGSIHRLERADLPSYLARKISPHEVDLKEVLALCELRGTLPATVVALGIEPLRVDLATELSPVVEDAMPQLLEVIHQELARWGYGAPHPAPAHA